MDLAREKGAFPLLDAEQYLAAPRFASRLPENIKRDIRTHGLRNSHLLSIAPTGTISLAFADNAANGIEPPYSWTYQRKKREADGSHKVYDVEDHAWRLFRHIGGDVTKLPPQFVTALEISALDHMRMVAAVAPFVDSAISKTVNVPENYPFEEFKDLYLEAWKAGLKGITTYRPNGVLGSVLSVTPQVEAPNDLDTSDADRRIRLDAAPMPGVGQPALAGPAAASAGNPAWTYMVESPFGQFAIFVGHVDNGDPHAFEVWVNGNEQPRGLGAVAKTLSMDMRAQDRAWLRTKLDILSRTAGDDAFDCPMPPDGAPVRMPSTVAAFARIVSWRVEQLGGLTPRDDRSPVLDALFAKKEPKTGTDGTMSWSVDVYNPSSGDDFVLILKELVLPSGQRRPYSVWMAGSYPRSLDGLCKLLSLDMRVIDPAWIGMKLRKLLSYAEPLGDFMAKVPGEEKQRNWPSTVAYVAQLMIHRYAMLGVLDERGYPIDEMGVLEIPDATREREARNLQIMPGKRCLECGNSAGDQERTAASSARPAARSAPAAETARNSGKGSGLAGGFDHRHPQVGRRIDALAIARGQCHRHVHEAAVPAADQHFGVAGHRRVHGIARHVPAVDAVRGRGRHAADGVARIDVLQRDLAAGPLVVLGDALAQEHADILELRVAALVRCGRRRRHRPSVPAPHPPPRPPPHDLCARARDRDCRARRARLPGSPRSRGSAPGRRRRKRAPPGRQQIRNAGPSA